MDPPARDIRQLPCTGRPELAVIGRTEIQTPLPALDIPFAPGCSNIYLGYKGTKQMQAEGRIYSLSAGECFITPPGVEHHTGPMSVSRCAHYWLRIDLGCAQPFLGQAAGEALRRRLATLPTSHGRFSEAELAAVRRLFDLSISVRDELDDLELGLQLGLFLVRLLDRLASAPEPADAPRMARVTAWLQQHLGEDCSVPELAEVAGCSPSALTALIKRHHGLSPADHVTRLKMAAAERLLLETELSVRAISERLGYSTPRYFSTVFRRFHPQAPGAFRQQRRRG